MATIFTRQLNLTDDQDTTLALALAHARDFYQSSLDNDPHPEDGFWAGKIAAVDDLAAAREASRFVVVTP